MVVPQNPHGRAHFDCGLQNSRRPVVLASRSASAWAAAGAVRLRHASRTRCEPCVIAICYDARQVPPSGVRARLRGARRGRARDRAHQRAVARRRRESAAGAQPRRHTGFASCSSTCSVTARATSRTTPAQHRMDRYARQVVALLDELGVQRAVVGGVSLGANVSLHVAVQAPDRVAALLVEMPVLEWATPAAASLFVPLLLAVSFGRRLFGFATSLVRRLPRTGIDPLDSFLGTFSMEPEAIAAVLHGILVGPVAPEIEERCAIAAPTLIIGHENDLIHPFSDAENLAQPDPGCAPRPRPVHVRAAARPRAAHAGDRPLPQRGVRETGASTCRRRRRARRTLGSGQEIVARLAQKPVHTGRPETRRGPVRPRFRESG